MEEFKKFGSFEELIDAMISPVFDTCDICGIGGHIFWVSNDDGTHTSMCKSCMKRHIAIPEPEVNTWTTRTTTTEYGPSRLEIAARIASGIVCGVSSIPDQCYQVEVVAKVSLSMADALIKEVGKEAKNV